MLWSSLSLGALEGEIERGERERSRGLGLDRGAVGLRWAAGMGRPGVGRPTWALFSLSLTLILSLPEKKIERRKEREGLGQDFSHGGNFPGLIKMRLIQEK